MCRLSSIRLPFIGFFVIRDVPWIVDVDIGIFVVIGIVWIVTWQLFALYYCCELGSGVFVFAERLYSIVRVIEQASIFTAFPKARLVHAW